MFTYAFLELLTCKQETKEHYTTLVNLGYQMFYDRL